MAKRNADQPDNSASDEESENVAALAPTRLIEGVRDFLLRSVRENGMKTPWQKMTEGQQTVEIQNATDRAERLVQDVIDHVTVGDFPVVRAIIDTFQVKDGTVKIVSSGIAEDLALLTLNHAGKKAVKIIVADVDQFDQDRSNLEADPDQPALPGTDEPGFEEDEDQAPEPEIENPDGESEAGEEILAPKSDQWRGGFNSRMGAHQRTACPFRAETMDCIDWLAGWDAADFDAQAPEIVTKPDQAADVERSKHWIEGQEAAQKGGEITGNPYVRKAMKQEWIDGFNSVPATDKPEPAEPEADPTPEPEPEVEEPSTDGPVTKPDLPAEEETDPSGGAVDIPNEDGEPIETADQANAFGMYCRREGQGTASNPFPVISDFGKAWLRGYNAQKQIDAAAEF